MITKLTIENFKLFEHAEIDLSDPVVFIGPNNSGKTSALQALALWNLSVKKWVEKRGNSTASKRTGVTINRNELTFLPVRESRTIWRNTKVKSTRTDEKKKQRTENIYLNLIVKGQDFEKEWKVGLKLYYANPESFYCQLMDDSSEIPEEIAKLQVAILPPMSGLSESEDYFSQKGSIDSRIGIGKTAEVLRNLCYRVYDESTEKWEVLKEQMDELFGVIIIEPKLNPADGQLYMDYKNSEGIKLELLTAGRGMLQTLLLISFMLDNPGSIIMVDEPDAHLEILRQRQIFTVLQDIASRYGNQLIFATHSEIVMESAADLVAFIGKSPKSIDSQQRDFIRKSLTEISFDKYYLAELRKWIIFLEGDTDLQALKAFARKLDHPALDFLQSPFVEYSGNDYKRVNRLFSGLKDAVTDLSGFALFDRLDRTPDQCNNLAMHQWTGREIENYFAYPDVIMRWVDRMNPTLSLFPVIDSGVIWRKIKGKIPPDALKNLNEPYWKNHKASDEFLDIIFREYSEEKGGYVLLKKNEYHRLIEFMEPDEIDQEVIDVLDQIFRIASKAESEA